MNKSDITWPQDFWLCID